MMDPRRLRLLLELSRRGSMRAVADELGYTTSTVSQQLAVLAREAGTPLIEPAGRMVRLTPAGRRLADHFHLNLLDTGLTYRAVAHRMVTHGLPLDNVSAAETAARP